MRCPRCEADTPDGAKFCIECGTPLMPRCPQCGADALPRAKFCAECGTPLTAQAQRRPLRLPHHRCSYTPAYLAEKILTSKSRPGRRAQAGHGAVCRSQRLDGTARPTAIPEDARQLLDPVLDRMMDAVHRYEGTVNQVHGRWHYGAVWRADCP